VAKSVDMLFRSLPTKTFGFYERNEFSPPCMREGRLG